jgi:predicted peptidase
MKFVVALGALLLCSLAQAQTPASKPDIDKLLDKLTFTKGQTNLPYRLLKPDGYDKNGTDRYPLVVFLHGSFGRGTDNQKQIRSGVEEFLKDATRKKHPCFLAIPQCPPDKLWFDVSGSDTKGNLPLPKSPTESAALVLDLIEALGNQYRIDKDRIYLTGLSMGGYGTWDLISRRPELFAAAIPICGGGDPAPATQLAKLSIWAFHGDADPLVPIARTRDMIAALKEAGGQPKLTEYKGVSHDAWTTTYKNSEVLDWLFEQKKGRRGGGEE